jgi:hypothetical protein
MVKLLRKKVAKKNQFLFHIFFFFLLKTTKQEAEHYFMVNQFESESNNARLATICCMFFKQVSSRLNILWGTKCRLK